MKRLIRWIRARLFARRWAAMRKSAMYQTDCGAWDYQPRQRGH